MAEPTVVIVGGGLAGLSAACYARASGFRTRIIEHGTRLGGVCTAWQRGSYLVDGCIHWLTGGPFSRVYEELGILDGVMLRPLQHFVSVRNLKAGLGLEVTADLDDVGRQLEALAPEDAPEIQRLIAGARLAADVGPPIDKAPELFTLRDGARLFWEMRHELGTFLHFRQPLAQYVAGHYQNAGVRQLLTSFLPGEAPAVFLLLVLGYLSRGWLSRPVGGSARFRDALVDTYQRLGGEVQLSATVDEIVIDAGRARGVIMSDGTWLDADAVICTSSVPEAVFRLLGGRQMGDATERRLREWKLFNPIVLASFGLGMPLGHLPQMLLLGGIEPFDVGGVPNDKLYLRIYNDDPCFAPPGHSVLQVMLETGYKWWAQQGADYSLQKERLGKRLLAELDRYFPGVGDVCDMIDIATPLTYWNEARSWRGAYEGWMPTGGSAFGEHLPHRVPGVSGLYMAGQWVEPGGGVPMACMSGRQAAQVLCHDLATPFSVPHAVRVPG